MKYCALVLVVGFSTRYGYVKKHALEFHGNRFDNTLMIQQIMLLMMEISLQFVRRFLEDKDGLNLL